MQSSWYTGSDIANVFEVFVVVKSRSGSPFLVI